MENLNLYIKEALVNHKVKSKEYIDYVDLGLPSGTLWATCNVGADKPEDPGLLFQFGCTKGYKYNEISPEEIIKNYEKLTNYKREEVLPKSGDAAYKETNGRFRTPTKEECEELLNHTDIRWINVNSVNGTAFISKKDNSKWIFIPAGGCFSDYDKEFMLFNNRTIIMSTKSFAAKSLASDSYYYILLGCSNDKNIYYMTLKSAVSVRGVLNK